MAAIKNAIKGFSTIVGELLVVGGALGTTYVLGFIKGSEVKPKIEKACDEIAGMVKTKTEEEPVTEESEPESETVEEEETPTITVSTNQAED